MPPWRDGPSENVSRGGMQVTSKGGGMWKEKGGSYGGVSGAQATQMRLFKVLDNRCGATLLAGSEFRVEVTSHKKYSGNRPLGRVGKMPFRGFFFFTGV